MKVKLAAVFAAGFAAATLLGYGAGRPSVDCRTGDLTRGVAPTSKSVEALFGDWIHDVRACRVGDYTVVAPAQSGVSDLLLSRNGKPFLIAAKGETIVMDDDHVLYDREPGRKISVAAYNKEQRTWIEHVDLDADGTIDWRTIDAAGRPPRHEVRIGDRWLEVIRRDGQTGTVVDGRFMSIDEAKATVGMAAVTAVSRRPGTR